MKLLEKAYRAWIHSDIGEYPVLKPEHVEIIYAKNKSEAKGRCDLRDGKNEYDEPATWIDIKCVRVQHMDRLEGEDGYPTLRFQYAAQLQKDKRNNIIDSLDENDMYYVQDSRSYLGNLVYWWAKGSNGYTTYIDKAEKYTKEQLIKNFKNTSSTNLFWSVKHVNEKISKHVDIQNLDRTFSV